MRGSEVDDIMILTLMKNWRVGYCYKVIIVSKH